MSGVVQEGSISEIASALMRFTALGGNINERFTEDQLSPGVEELDTLLHVAIRHRRVDAVRHLLGKGANPNIQNWHLETPRMAAERMGLEHLLGDATDRDLSTVWSEGATFTRPKLVTLLKGVSLCERALCLCRCLRSGQCSRPAMHGGKALPRLPHQPRLSSVSTLMAVLGAACLCVL